jgi:hypothetical protein
MMLLMVISQFLNTLEDQRITIKNENSAIIVTKLLEITARVNITNVSHILEMAWTRWKKVSFSRYSNPLNTVTTFP